MKIPWPEGLVAAVRHVKLFFGWFSAHSVAGIPADWIGRFVLLGLVYFVLTRGIRRRYAAALCMGVLVGSELLELIWYRSLTIHNPDSGDVADVLTGVAGIAAAEASLRLWNRRRASLAGRSA